MVIIIVLIVFIHLEQKRNSKRTRMSVKIMNIVIEKCLKKENIY